MSYRRKEKCCQRCFAYVRSNSRKCRHCGYVFKSAGRHFFDKVRQFLKLEEAHPVKNEKQSPRDIFFTLTEIDSLLEMSNYRGLVYMKLSDIQFLDETSLLGLAETLALTETGFVQA